MPCFIHIKWETAMQYKNFTIENVNIEKVHEGEFKLHFSINDFLFYVMIYRNKNIMYPVYIVHGESEGICPICQNTNVMYQDCIKLNEDFTHIFNVLKEHPNVRLLFLYNHFQ
jgi:hypothetical protein